MADIKSASGESKRRSPKKLDSIEIKHAANGGHVVRHNFVRKTSDGYPMHEEPEEHVFGADEGHKALKHVAHHLGIKVEIGPAKGAEGHEPDDADDGDDGENE